MWKETFDTWYLSATGTAYFVIVSALILTIFPPSMLPTSVQNFVRGDMMKIVALLLIVYYSSTLKQEGVFISLAILVLYSGLVSKGGNESFAGHETGLDEKAQPAAYNESTFGPQYSCEPPAEEEIGDPQAVDVGADFTQAFLEPPILP